MFKNTRIAPGYFLDKQGKDQLTFLIFFCIIDHFDQYDIEINFSIKSIQSFINLIITTLLKNSIHPQSFSVIRYYFISSIARCNTVW